jgi:hypothetical protein
LPTGGGRYCLAVARGGSLGSREILLGLVEGCADPAERLADGLDPGSNLRRVRLGSSRDAWVTDQDRHDDGRDQSDLQPYSAHLSGADEPRLSPPHGIGLWLETVPDPAGGVGYRGSRLPAAPEGVKPDDPVT